LRQGAAGRVVFHQKGGCMMITCFMFGNYTTESLQRISADRTKEAVIQLQELGGKVKSMYALLGDQDLIFIVDFPDVNTAIKASVALTNLIGVPSNGAIMVSLSGSPPAFAWVDPVQASYCS